MRFELFETVSLCLSVYVLAFDDIFVDGSTSMIDQGRTQYQLLREKGNLPRYGPCWKGALDHVEEGCRHLSEDTQSDMALHLTNCFLEMSGHETYNCELDKKPNLRGICISSMSDRAFNVYTEFYTHVQNICWFLRGQIWHETISESTFKVGKQLENSAMNQEVLLKNQKESLEIQQKLLKHEKALEQVLGDLYVNMKAHKDILGLLTQSVSRFQEWVIGEISWFDSIIFYTILGFSVLVVTSVKRTNSARLPLIVILVSNLMVERLICQFSISRDSLLDVKFLYRDIYSCIWFCRKVFVFIIICYLFYHSYFYKDIALENNTFLRRINEQNSNILDILGSINNNYLREKSPSDRFSLVNESPHCNGFLSRSLDLFEGSGALTDDVNNKVRKKYYSKSNLVETHRRYNLRSSKQNTPELD